MMMSNAIVVSPLKWSEIIYDEHSFCTFTIHRATNGMSLWLSRNCVLRLSIENYSVFPDLN
jgi:hypothetical protein